jgi:two-component system sensor histidine kinase BaeS
LRTRLFAAIGLIVVVSVGVALAIGVALTRREVERTALRDLGRQADVLAKRESDSVCPLCRVESLQQSLAPQRERVEVARLDGSSDVLPAPAAQRVRRGLDAKGTIGIEGTEYFYAARRVGQKALVLLRPKRLSANASKPYLEGLFLAALAGATLAAVASFFLARAISRPVRRVAEATRDVAAGRSPDPVPVEGPSELALLAASFNEMATQLTKARRTERQFLLSVSHELKTPLTAIRGYAEGLSDEAVPWDEAADTIVREAARLERLVRDLLDLARMNRSEFSVHSEPIDLGDVARETVRRHEGQAREFGVGLEALAEAPAPALGDADRTLQIASNLVENALRLTPPGGVVRVRADPGVLAVEDTGPGLKPEELPHAFERFYLYSRYGRERPVGTGLGLAIVEELTKGMHGTVRVESEPGRGAVFTVRLPSAPAGDPVERELVGA